MSTPRNTLPSTPRRRHTGALTLAALSVIVTGLTACSADRATAPVASSVAQASESLHATKAPTPAPKPKQSDKDDDNRLSIAQLNADTATWHTQPSDVESGTDRPLPLACGWRGMFAVSQPVGPKGGTIRFGTSSLKIPKGALTSTVQISATITLGSSVQVTFAPHGLKFNKPVQIVANYSGCTMPSGGAINVYYTNDSGGIVQSMPSANNTTQRHVVALTDHFSGYTVAWGRTSY